MPSRNIKNLVQLGSLAAKNAQLYVWEESKAYQPGWSEQAMTPGGNSGDGGRVGGVGGSPGGGGKEGLSGGGGEGGGGEGGEGGGW